MYAMQIDVTELLDKKYIDKYTKISENYISTKICNQYQKSVLIRRSWDMSQEFAYILGLWCGDKYVYGNRIGLSNKNTLLLGVFENFLKKITNSKEACYVFERGEKTKVYINSALLRRILEALENDIKKFISNNFLAPYIAGRIDSDGCILLSNIKHKSGLAKITYGSFDEAKTDKEILNSFGYNCSINNYKDRNGFDLKLSVLSCLKIFPQILEYIKHEEKKQKILFCLEAFKTIKLVP